MKEPDREPLCIPISALPDQDLMERDRDIASPLTE
jgi:hypothetical protein